MNFLRVTVIGARRKADLALPDDSPIEDLLPEIVDLLDEPATAAPLVLTTLLGAPVDAAASLASQDIANGTVLRLLARDAAPQPPDVAEVTEAVADAAVTRRDRWSPTLTAIALGAVVALVSGVSAAVLPSALGVSVLALVFFLGAVAGAVLTRAGNAAGCYALFGLSAGVAFPLAGKVVASWAPGSGMPAVLGAALAWVLLWVAVAVVFGIGARRRSIVLGTVVALLTGAVVVLTDALSAPVPTVVAFSGVVAAALLGLAPSLALTAAGVTRFDDAVIDGETVRRRDVSAAITEAFTGQTFLVLALAAPLMASILLLLGGGLWERGLAAALAVFVLVRARLFPLAVARIALLLAAVIPAVVWLSTATEPSADWRAAIGAAICAVLVLTTLPRPSAAGAARLRRVLGIVEALAVVAMVPLILGLLGVFGDLLGAFS
ncbi:MAG: EsaB/YukD family protein [Arachnia sp.]